MNQSATHSELHRYVIQLALALICLLGLNAISFGFQADEKDPAPAAAEQKEDGDESKDDDKAKDEAPAFLKIGSPAPALNLDYWPTDNNGLLPAVKKFEAGKIYVVNFFAIDNEYSVGKLESMVELQKKYSDDPVQIVCVSIGGRDATEEFLDTDVKGKDNQTYLDLLNPISSAVDSTGKTTIDYMTRSGMLTAWTFIVGKTGKLEWLGPPTDVAEPLAKVVKGKWDRKAFAKEIEPKQNQQIRRAKANEMFAKWIVKANKNKPGEVPGIERFNELLGTLREGAKDPANKAFRTRIEYTRMSLMLRLYAGQADIENLESDLMEAMKSFTKLSLDDLNSELNNSAWSVYEMYEAGRIEKDAEILKVAKTMAEKALEFRPKSGAVNDTMAHFAYLIDGDLDRAIELQERAIENSGDTQSDELEAFLKFLKKEQATGKKKSLQKKDDEEAAEESDF